MRRHGLSGLMLAALAAAAVSCSGGGNSETATPDWLESDSAQAIQARLLRDFPYGIDEAVALMDERWGGVTEETLRQWIDSGYVETMVIDGTERVFRKSIRNLGLLKPDLSEWTNRGENASELRLAYVDSALTAGSAHKVRYRFTIAVPPHPELDGDTLRVWMPYPLETSRQSEVCLISATPSEFIMSNPEVSPHSTIYFEQPASATDTVVFSYEGEFVTQSQYFAPEYILRNLRGYDTESAEYQQYTAFDDRHYVRLDSLARAIAGDETNPYRLSEKVFEYIAFNYPWAGAREYSTIESIPRYVTERGYGDCGQVSLLYISLMRTLGVPARWESGWMLHPGEKNFHDWAEVYYEGVGWVPVDVSFGRYTNAETRAARDFYSTGIDSWRFASNAGISGQLYPGKRYLRSETVDLQAGEVECGKGNLFYPAWDSSFEILSVTECDPAPDNTHK